MNQNVDSESDVEYRMVEGNKQTTGSFNTKRPFYHPSNTPDTFIKNAVTGVPYPWKTGTFDARRLFKIVDTTGRYDTAGMKMRPTASNYPNPNANHCYYDSPLQYMTHTRQRMNSEFVDQWHLRQIEFTQKDNSTQ